MPETMAEVVPYILGALVIVIIASAYFIRDSLREHSRVLKQKNDLDLAKQQLELKLSAQELSYKKELQETITKLNDDMDRLRRQYADDLAKEVSARNKLERRILELENSYRRKLNDAQLTINHLNIVIEELQKLLVDNNIEIPTIKLPPIDFDNLPETEATGDDPTE